MINSVPWAFRYVDHMLCAYNGAVASLHSMFNTSSSSSLMCICASLFFFSSFLRGEGGSAFGGKGAGSCLHINKLYV